jgi:hypothetical protein
LMLLADIPWAGRVWALPFLTVLAPSERYSPLRTIRAHAVHGINQVMPSSRSCRGVAVADF